MRLRRGGGRPPAAGGRPLLARFRQGLRLIVITDGFFAGSVNNGYVHFSIAPALSFVVRLKSARLIIDFHSISAGEENTEKLIS